MRWGLYIRDEENMKCLKILVRKGRGHLENLGVVEAIGCEYLRMETNWVQT
jgi:hypothetical protein